MKYFYPEDYGALGDGKTNDVKAIQSAIDKAEENNGGVVVLTSGKTYFSDSIRMKKNVELHLQKGARLKATDNIEPNDIIFIVGKTKDIQKFNKEIND